jgi:hypothetical protein
MGGIIEKFEQDNKFGSQGKIKNDFLLSDKKEPFGFINEIL